MIAWPSVAEMLADLERDVAGYSLRIVNVATAATNIPPEDAKTGQRVHKGRFSGWIVQEAELDAPLVAVARLSDSSEVGITASGELVDVTREEPSDA